MKIEVVLVGPHVSQKPAEQRHAKVGRKAENTNPVMPLLSCLSFEGIAPPPLPQGASVPRGGLYAAAISVPVHRDCSSCRRRQMVRLNARTDKGRLGSVPVLSPFRP
jgi:hypothetical protein